MPDKLFPVSDAISRVLSHCSPLEAERIPIYRCPGRILRETIQVPFDVPPFDRSAMDGYALAGESLDGTYRLIGTIPAGTTESFSLQTRECVRIFTGAPIPGGADRVAIQEECQADGRLVRIAQPVKPGSHIRRRAEDARWGETALVEGQVLGPAQIGLAASLGKAELMVSRQPSVWTIITGTELVEPGQPLEAGQIYNSNAVQLAAQIKSFGGRPLSTAIASDELMVIIRKIEEGINLRVDMICISAGASVGEADYTRKALEQCGFQIHFHGVDLKPGKPTLFATRRSILAFGIPGNPVSHLAVFALLIAPALRALQGLPAVGPCLAELKEAWKGNPDRRDRWFPAIVQPMNASMQLQLLPWKGSGDLIACRNANAVANIPADATSLPLGTKIRYAPLAGSL